jgi:hypothetical protein
MSDGTSQGGRARALRGAAQARAVTGRAGGSVYGHGNRADTVPCMLSGKNAGILTTANLMDNEAGT